MNCRRCGHEVVESDRFCGACGMLLRAGTRDGERKSLRSLMLDVETGTLLINGHEVNNVTAFSLQFEDGKYGLEITHDLLFNATAR